MHKEKQKDKNEKQVKKKKTKLDNLDSSRKNRNKDQKRVDGGGTQSPRTDSTSPIHSSISGNEKRRTPICSSPTKKKQTAKKSKPQLPTTSAHYPFILVKAKTTFSETLQGKQLIKERVLNLESYKAYKVIQNIIKSCGWAAFYGKPDEGVLQLVREFYASMEEKKDDKVFMWDNWEIIISEAINELIGAPNHEEDNYSVLMDEGVDTKS